MPTRPFRRGVAVAAALLLPACAASKSVPPADPAGSVVTAVAGGSSIDFETGAIGGGGPDLLVDADGNMTATDRLADMGPVAGLVEVTALPAASAWIATAQGLGGHGFVVKTDQSNAYAVFVSGGASGGGRTIHWRLLPGVAVVRVQLAGGGVGSATSSVPGISCSATAVAWDCGEPYSVGASVTLTATPGDVTVTGCSVPQKSVVTEWGGVTGCTAATPCSVTASADVTATVTFQHTVSIQIQDPAAAAANGGTVTVGGATNPVCDGTHCLYDVVVDTPVTFTAVNGSLMFFQWAGSGPSGACGTLAGGFFNGTYSCASMPSPCTLAAGAASTPGCAGFPACRGTISQTVTATFN